MPTSSPLPSAVNFSRSRAAPATAVTQNPSVDQLERVGRYVVEGLLGRGSMGSVYLAYDPVVDRRVALKVVRRTLGGGDHEAARQRFLNEARAAGRLSHPNIVTVFDIGEDPALGLAHIHGRSMGVDARAAVEGRLRPGETRTLRVTLNPYSEKLKLAWED